MSGKIVLLTTLTGILVALSGCHSEVSKTAQPAESMPEKVIHVYYFHRTVRCPNCLKIESLAHETVKTFFPVELENGAVRWQAVNVDDAGAEHFVADYELSTQSLIIAEFSTGQQLRWKILDKVWELLDQDVDFRQYVETEIRDWL